MYFPNLKISQKNNWQLINALGDFFKDTNQKLGLNMDTLSMGTSHDYPAAIKAGSTLIRLGEALFGDRR